MADFSSSPFDPSLPADSSLYNVEKQAYTVYGLNCAVENQLKQEAFRNLTLVGEITEYKPHPSGHIYLTLQDKEANSGAGKSVKSSIRCTFFKGRNQSLRFSPQKGMEVLVRGEISFYHPSGQYNFNIHTMQSVGEGNLMRQIQELRKKLFAEGLSAPSRKRKPPKLPKRIGVITALSSAALRDILQQVHNRYPNVEVYMANALVQGEKAPSSLIAALQELQKEKWQCDLIVIGRGGGSPEDLMAFNDEALARAIAACRLPVVSAVGHQIDVSVSDDVADVTATTPTNAAELILPEVAVLEEKVASLFFRLHERVSERLKNYQDKLEKLQKKSFFQNPERLLEPYYNYLDQLDSSLRESFRARYDVFFYHLQQVPDIDFLAHNLLQEKKQRFTAVQERLEAYSPLATLKRGFSLTSKDGQIIRSAQSLNVGDKIHIRFAQGAVQAGVLLAEEKLPDF